MYIDYLQNTYDYEMNVIPLISNIALLKEKEKYWKAQIKRYKNQIKGSETLIDTLELEYSKELSKFKKKNNVKKKKNKKLYICYHCGTEFLTKEQLLKYSSKRKCNCTESPNSKPIFSNFKLCIYSRYSEKIKDVNFSMAHDQIILSHYTEIYTTIKERVIKLSLFCLNCRKKCNELIHTNCYSGHKVCQSCYDKINDSCPICSANVDITFCDICYCKTSKLESTKCGNHHKCCISCLTNISRINNLCPFCRGVMAL
jgi:hypothetical protein